MSDEERHRLGHEEAKARILKAAARVYNQYGEGATVQQIAEEADYSTAALYKHFSDKEAIFQALWKSVKTEVLEVLQSEPPVELGFVGRLKWLLFEFADLAEDEEEIFLASMANSPSPTRRQHLDESVIDFYDGYQASVREIMKQGLDQGTLDDAHSAEYYGLALSGQIQALVEHWALEGPFPLKPRLEEMLDVFLRGAAAPGADLEPLAEKSDVESDDASDSSGHP